MVIAERSLEFLGEKFLLNVFEKEQILKKGLVEGKKNSSSNQYNDTIITENRFAPKMSHIQINYAFLVF